MNEISPYYLVGSRADFFFVYLKLCPHIWYDTLVMLGGTAGRLSHYFFLWCWGWNLGFRHALQNILPLNYSHTPLLGVL